MIDTTNLGYTELLRSLVQGLGLTESQARTAIARTCDWVEPPLTPDERSAMATDKTPYSNTLDGDDQVTTEEAVAAALLSGVYNEWGRTAEEGAAHAGRDLVYLVLRKFRPDVFVDSSEFPDSQKYAKVVWTVSDVQTLFDVDDEAAEEFLVSHAELIQERMVERGRDAIRTCGVMDGLKQKESD